MTLQEVIRVRDLLLSDRTNIALGLAILDGFELEHQNLFYQIVVKDIIGMNHFIKQIESELPEQETMPPKINNFTDFQKGIGYLIYVRSAFQKMSPRCRKELETNRFYYLSQNMIDSPFYFQARDIKLQRIKEQYYLCYGISPDGIIGRCMAYKLL